MPELPEVETIKKGLNKYVLGKKILKVEIIKPKIVSSSSNIRKVDVVKVFHFENNLRNNRIECVERIAKHLIVKLEKGLIIFHLKMTGQVLLGKENINKHTCIIFHLEDNILVFNDIRQFGYCLYFDSYEGLLAKGLINNYGQDPYLQKLNFDEIKVSLGKIKKPIKSVFFDQKVLCGIGNIYADEISFASKILPSRLSNSLTETEIENILKYSKLILTKAVKEGGSSISDYKNLDGVKGNYAKFHKVYGRKGKNCIDCNNILSSTKISGRTTIFCSVCQH
jgi:formamidopyrimidine-DNA glycosylase